MRYILRGSDSRQKHDGKEEHGGYISLQDSIRTLDAAWWDQKDLLKSKERQESVALMSGARPGFDLNYKYDKPLYGSRFNKYRINRYRQNDEKSNVSQSRLSNTVENYLNQYIYKNGLENQTGERYHMRPKIAETYDQGKPTNFR